MPIDKPLIIRKADDMAAIADNVVKALESSLSKFEKLVIANTDKVAVANSAEIALAKENIKALLVESGYYKEVGVLLNDDYAKAVNASHDMYKSMYNKSMRFSPESLNSLSITKQLDLNQFNMLGDKAADQLTQGLIEMQYGAVTRQQLVTEMVGNTVGTLRNQANTQVRTGMQGYFRQSNVKLAEDAGIDKYEYVGPGDDITRDFCNDHIGQVKTLKEWDNLDNGQLGPVSVFGGGYNCRHQLVAVE